MEYLRLLVKDLDFGQRQILVRDGKGMKDRVTMLPDQRREAGLPNWTKANAPTLAR